MSGEENHRRSLDELIASAKANDRAALERLFHWCQPVLEGWAAKRIGKKHAGVARPSDIVQEAGVRAFRSIASFEGTTEIQLLAWLSAIFESCTVQAFRDAGRRKRDPAAETALDEPGVLQVAAHQKSPSQVTADAEEWRLVLGWIFQLPEEQKQAIWLCHLREMRVAAAAEQMGKSEPAVAGLLQRGLKTLRERMASVSNEGSPINAAVDQAELGALLSYLRRRDAGEQVDVASFVAEHPSCASGLRATLEWVERLQALRLVDVHE